MTDMPTISATPSDAPNDGPPNHTTFGVMSVGDGSPPVRRSCSKRRSARDCGSQVVAISPPDLVHRHSMTAGGVVVELVEAKSHARIEYRYRASSHLLVAYVEGARSDGETIVEGAARSTLRDFANKLTFVPAGHDYFEVHVPRTPTRVLFVTLDPAVFEAAAVVAGVPTAARVFFANPMLWGTVMKLRGLLQDPHRVDRGYFDALATVLVHEIAQLGRGDGALASVKGGLASWQQRVVATYIEEHLSEPISLARLAELAHLSTYHFSRAFKQSFGMPPHRYHTSRRIEHGKLLLEARTRSVTDIGLTLGFSETSAFSAAFRKATGLTPTSYHRSMD